MINYNKQLRKDSTKIFGEVFMKAKVTDDQAQVHYIKEQLARNNGYCPSVPGSVGLDKYRCPCEEFKQAKKGELCRCGLYIKTKE